MSAIKLPTAKEHLELQEIECGEEFKNAKSHLKRYRTHKSHDEKLLDISPRSSLQITG